MSLCKFGGRKALPILLVLPLCGCRMQYEVAEQVGSDGLPVGASESVNAGASGTGGVGSVAAGDDGGTTYPFVVGGAAAAGGAGTGGTDGGGTNSGGTASGGTDGGGTNSGGTASGGTASGGTSGSAGEPSMSGSGGGGAPGATCTPKPDGPGRDADSDGIPDYFDPDDDNDGTSDLEECFPTAQRFVNPSFEFPALLASPDFEYVPTGDVPGWSNLAGNVEVWAGGFNGVFAVEGNQHIELTGRDMAQDTMWQDIATVPGSTLRWGFYHRNRMEGDDTVDLYIGEPGAAVVQGSFTTGLQWQRYEGTYDVPSGQTSTRFEFHHIMPERGEGNFLDQIDAEPICTIDTDGDGCVDSEDPD